jgi:hypothetical protein
MCPGPVRNDTRAVPPDPSEVVTSAVADLDALTQIMPGHAMPPAADSWHGLGRELPGGIHGRLTLFS